MQTIKLRPHHLLCAVGFQGKGYSPNFVRNFKKIMAELNGENGDAIMIEIVGRTDDVCAPCPHKRDALCVTQDKISQLDNAHTKVLQITPGQQFTWGEAKKLIKEKMTLANFHQACDGCSWKEYGVCEEALKKLHSAQ